MNLLDDRNPANQSKWLLVVGPWTVMLLQLVEEVTTQKKMTSMPSGPEKPPTLLDTGSVLAPKDGSGDQVRSSMPLVNPGCMLTCSLGSPNLSE